MLLKSIEIKNFRAIKDIAIDLTSKGSSSDPAELKLGMFKKTNDNKVIPAFISIFGRNSVGKSTILDAIAFLFHARVASQNVFINNQILSKMQRNITMDQINLDFAKRNSIIMSKKQMSPLDISKNEEKIALLNIELNQKKEKFGKFNLFLGNPIKFNNEFNKKIILEDKDKKEFSDMIISEKHDMQKKWFQNNKCYDGQEESISIAMNFEIDLNDYKLTLNLDKNGLLLFNNTNNDEIDQKIENYIKEIEILINKDKMKKFLNEEQFIEDTILNLKRTLGSVEKLRKLIQLADEDVTNIYINNIANTPNTHNSFLQSIPRFERITNIEIRGNKLGVRQLSHGTIRFIYLANLILNTKGSLILIDEIDIYLHKELMDMLKILMQHQFEKYGTQTIFTTHSPLMVDKYTKFKQIYSLSKNDEEGIQIEKLSKKFKNNNMSVIKRYLKGELANYPDTEKARNMMVDILYEQEKK